MSIQTLLTGKSFDPETLSILDQAFQGVCADLGVTEKTPHSRALVAKKVIELADGRPDPEVIRAAVVMFLKAQH
jgi:hypothetical protein